MLVPADPGALSAKGMLLSDVVIDRSEGVLAGWDTWADDLTGPVFRRLEADAAEALGAELAPGQSSALLRSLDMRYAGQSYELNVPGVGDPLEAFHRIHRRRFGYADPERPVEVVAARVRGVGRTDRPDPVAGEPAGEDAADARVGEREVIFPDGPATTAVYRREALRPGNRVPGPAVIGEYTATTLVPPRFVVRVDRFGNLRIRCEGPSWEP